MWNSNLIVLSAPSGSGKTSLANRLIDEMTDLEFSVSYTTRAKRRGEVDGREYFFVDEKTFRQMIGRGEFLEQKHVYGNYYGTSSKFVESRLRSGTDVLLDIDVQGALEVKEKFPQAVLIFVFPPSFEVLERRLRGRGLDDEEAVKRRLETARREIEFYDRYDYTVINDDIETTLNDLILIIAASRCRTELRRPAAEEIRKTFQTGDRKEK